KGQATRPTSERVREALASALDARGRIVDAHVLDLYAGTGALSFEVLSRGASRAVLVERERRVAQQIRANAESLGLSERVEVVSLDLETDPTVLVPRLARRGRAFDLVFADPPYDRTERVLPLLAALATSAAAQAACF